VFWFHRPAPRDARRARTTRGRADGNASHPTMNRASGTRKGTDMDAYATRQKDVRDNTSGAGRAAIEYWPDGEVIGARRPARASSLVSKALGRSNRRPQGPARAVMGSLRDRWWCVDVIDALAILLLDGLSAAIRLRLSSLSAGPDAMEAGVVFAGCTIPPDGLPILHPYPVARPRARSGRDGVGVVCLCLGSSGWSPLAAMVPNLRESVGGHRPQFPVRESKKFRRRGSSSVLATLADGEEERRDDDMDHLAGLRWSA
jgi:hypothetical protein